MTHWIICSVDFSSSSREVIKWSVQIAQKLNVHLMILYTYRIFKQNGEPLVIKKEMEEMAIRNFKIVEKEFLYHSLITYDFKIEIGFISDRVKEYSKNNIIDFLVIGKSASLQNKEGFDEMREQLHIPFVIVP